MLEWSNGVESDFGVEMWATLQSIQTKSGHILENTKNINFRSAGVDVNSYQTL